MNLINQTLKTVDSYSKTKIMPIILESRKNEDVRAVKEADSRPAVAKRMGSNPIPRKEFPCFL